MFYSFSIVLDTRLEVQAKAQFLWVRLVSKEVCFNGQTLLTQVVYMCSSLLELAPGSRDLSQA